MKRLIKVLVGALVVAVAVVGFMVFRAKDALFPAPNSAQELATKLTPSITVHKPDGVGPFPAVLVFHGCAGLIEKPTQERIEWLTSEGYVAVIIDSFIGRGIDRSLGNEGWMRICNGYELHGNERSADVYVALEYARGLDFIDSNRLALMGYSHGGWTILDALAYENRQLPPGLTDKPKAGLSGVKALVAYYPYCGWPAEHSKGWSSKIPVLSLLAGQDSIVDVNACIAVDEMMKTTNPGVLKSILYADSDHVFDTQSRLNTYQKDIANQALSEISQFLKQQFSVN